MLRHKTLWIAILAVMGCAQFSAGQSFNFPLSGLQEFPVNASPAVGSCLVVVDDPNDLVSVNCSYSGLTGGAVTGAHIHGAAPPGANAGVILPLTPVGSPNGTINQLPSPMTQTNINHILAGNAYVNIHTSSFPGGEIRGQIVPEPTGLAAYLVSGGALSLLRRKR